MFYTNEKLHNRICELSTYRYRGHQQISAFKTYEPAWQERNQVPETYSAKTLCCGQTWCGRDKYLWLNTELIFNPLEEDFELDKTTVFLPMLYLDLGRTGGGNNSGFESLIYVNGNPIQAVDSNHKEVFLRDIRNQSYAKPIDIDTQLTIDIQLWSGLEGGGAPRVQTYEILEAWYGWLDTSVDAFYFRMKAVLESALTFSEEQPEKHKLIQILNQAINVIDWTHPGSGSFYKSLKESADLLEMALKELQNTISHSAFQVMTIGHSHIDLAWLWQLHHTMEKAKRSFSTVLQLMASDATYTYLQSQPQIYEWIEKNDPELFSAISSRIDEGRWIPEGAMWVEADCNIPSGESLVRQLFYGKRYFREKFGKDNRVLWLPDVFGYSWALPQILRKSGVDCFVTTKISWNQYNRMPADTFIWRGIDGTEIPTHFITTPEPGRPKDSWFYTYNGYLSAETVKGIWRQYRQKDVNSDLLLAYGYGDGGGGPNREMLAMQKYLNEVPGMPKVTPSKFDDFFKDLTHKLDNSKAYVHTWDGELYLEYHRGTYTSQAAIKRNNRRMEMALMALEIASVLHCSKQMQVGDWKSKIEALWKEALLLQFHDILPGSSIPEVYADADAFYNRALPQAEAMTLELLDGTRVGVTDNYSFFNPTQLTGPFLMTLPSPSKSMHQDNESTNSLVLLENVMPFGLTAIDASAIEENLKEPLGKVDLMNGEVETEYYKVHWDASGRWTGMYDQSAGREMILPGCTGNRLMLYEDKPMAHEAWDIDLYYIEKQQCLNTLGIFNAHLEKSSSLELVVRFEWRTDVADIQQRIKFYKHTKRIDFETHVDWRGRQKLLKVAFDLNVRTHEAIFDIQFGNVKRPNHWNTSWDMAKFETVGHHWAALSEPCYGIALLNDSKYGYSALGHTLALTLLKGATHPDPKADMGKHLFTYALFPFNGYSDKYAIAKEGLMLNCAFRVLKVAGNPQGGLLDLIGDGVIVDAIKCAEMGEGYIVRLHEMEGNHSEIKLNWHPSWKKLKKVVWREVDLLEAPLDDFVFEGSEMILTFKPYEIKTLYVSCIDTL